MNAQLICDRPELRAELESRLAAGGLTVGVHNFRGAAAICDSFEGPSLVVLDGLGGDPWNLCRRIRAQAGGNLAVIWIVVEANDSQSHRAAREAGADDCIPWPPESDWFDLRLAAAVRQIAAMQEIPRAKAALRESTERWSLAERGAHGGVWDARLNGLPLDSPESPVWYSEGMKQIFGFSEAEFPNVLGSWMSRMHPDEVQPVIQAIKQCLEEKSPFEIEYRLLTKTAGYRWFSSRGQGIFDPQGRLVRVTGSVRDITENRHVADALQASEAKWRSLVENAPDTITVIDPDGKILFMNRDWLGVANERSLGADFVSLVPEERRDSVRSVLQEVAGSGRPGRFELTISGSDGTLIWYASRVGPVHSTPGVAALIVITTDITARKRHEAALRQEQELLRRLLDLHERDRQLVAYEIHDGLAQEMTAALMHLQAFQHIAAERLENTDFDRGLSLLREAVQEARRLISGLRPPVLDELGIVAAIEYLIHEIQADVPDIRFVHRTKFARLAAPLESAIFRIVQESLSNIRAHSGGGRAKIELIEHGQQLRLVVRDWGKGFDPAHINEGRFGLQGIRQRGRLLGAKVVIDSHPGKGTTVVVDFPLILNRKEDDSERGAPANS
jgi:PAS domain S-box-containing protein